jgi:hypothetical protein
VLVTQSLLTIIENNYKGINLEQAKNKNIYCTGLSKRVSE